MEVSSSCFYYVIDRLMQHPHSKTSTASWTNTLRIRSDAWGLSVELVGQIKPTFSGVISEGQIAVDIERLHAKCLPSSIDVQDVLVALKGVMEGQWGFSAPGMQRCLVASPIVTKSGGIILQLCQNELVQGASTSTATITGTQQSTIANVLSSISKCQAV